MSEKCEKYTSMTPSNSSILLTSLAHNQDWWSYRQLRALQTNRTEGQFGHRPIYKPIVSLSLPLPPLSKSVPNITSSGEKSILPFL